MISLSRLLSRLHRVPTDQERRGRGRDARGTAILEFAFIAPLLAMFIFGIITFGLILSFDQNITQASDEAARAGAVAVPVGGEKYAFGTGEETTVAEQAATNAATEAANNALGGFGRNCGDVEVTCGFTVEPCVEGIGACLVVTISYDYDAYPFLPEIPLLNAAYPDTLSNQAVVQINPGFAFDGTTGGDGSDDGVPECSAQLDITCRTLCNASSEAADDTLDPTEDDGIPNCLANPLEECNDAPGDGIPDCSPTQTCDLTAENGVPDCLAEAEGEACDLAADSGVADCSDVPATCDDVPGGSLPDCLAAPDDENCDTVDNNNGIPQCPPCDLDPDTDAADCVSTTEGETCDAISNNGVPACDTEPPCDLDETTEAPDCEAPEGETCDLVPNNEVYDCSA